MSGIRRVSLCAAWTLMALSLASTACKNKDPDAWKTGSQLTNERMDVAKATKEQHDQDMADNAILHDMSVADFHFVPHSAELSGTGVHRLDRMAPLLNTYGGTVRYETYLTDNELVNKRLDHVKEYLTVVGCNMDRVDVKPMLSGGRGTTAEKAIAIDIKGTVAPEGGGGMPVMTGAAAPGGPRN